jgi:hypothetical protein
VLETVLRMVAV